MEVMPKVTCPYCLNKYSKRKLVYLCPNDGQRFERPHFGGKRKTSSSFGSDINICCPSCYSVIPTTVIDAPFTSIAVVGAGPSGKTIYLTVALNELRNEVRFLTVSPLTEETSLWFDKNRDDIYLNKELLKPTKPFQRPLLWSVVNNHHKNGKSFSKHTMSILDICGDTLETVDDMLITTEYLTKCSSILFVVDPLMLNGVKKAAVINDEDVAASLADYEENIAETINAIAYKLREIRGIEKYKKMEIPFALVLTKMDMIGTFYKQKIGDNTGEPQLDQPMDYKSNMDNEDERVKKWLRDIGEEALLSVVANNFAVHKFFFVSSLGFPPRRTDSGYRCDSVRPVRVLDPLLWLLNCNHIID